VTAKRRGSRYEAGQRTGFWLKLKLDRQQEFVIGGYRPGTHGVDALAVGYYEGTALRYAGKGEGWIHVASSSRGPRRHAAFLGLRADKKPQQARRET
jgi:bifunctional non-homologous end joining protein LigD